MRKPPADHDRCTATTTKGTRCKFRRIEGLEECASHSDLWHGVVSFLYLDWEDGEGTAFDRWRAELERSAH
jgi:hypothetical protein